jgi:hypothetical protein
MLLAYCFIGPLPAYIIDSVHQARLFYQGRIVCLLTDHESPHARTLRDRYRVELVHAEKDAEFDGCVAEHQDKFSIIEGLKGRERLFVYAFERFFALQRFLSAASERPTEDIVFLELDNLIYADPAEWLTAFRAKEMAFMFDNELRCASGICYLRSVEVLRAFTRECLHYIQTADMSHEFMTEMQALYAFWKKNPAKVQLLPIHWPAPQVPPPTYENWERYRSVFDAAAIGIYLGGVDPYHTGGLVKTGLRSIWSVVDYTGYEFGWQEDAKGRAIPYVRPRGQTEWIRINQLHIHSKQLGPCLSAPMAD